MNYYEQSFKRLYENFVFSLTIYHDEHYRKLLLNQMLEKIETTYQTYKNLGTAPIYHLTQWKMYYMLKIKQTYIMNGG